MSVPAYQWASAVQAAGFDVVRATYGFAGVFPAFVAQRAARGVRHRLTRPGSPGPADIVEIPTVSSRLERVLLGLCRADERVPARRDLPFGSSVLVAAVKR